MWLERLETEHDNMRAALAWSLEVGTRNSGCGSRCALAWFWDVRGHYTDGLGGWRNYWQGLCRPYRGAGQSAGWAGRLMALYGDYERAGITTEEGLRLYQEIGIERGIARSLADLGWITLAQGDLERTRMLTEGLHGTRSRKTAMFVAVGSGRSDGWRGIGEISNGGKTCSRRVWR